MTSESPTPPDLELVHDRRRFVQGLALAGGAAVLGVPASREIAGRVRGDLLAKGAVDGETVASWGRRRMSSRPPIDPKEYVENLRSLGYLR